MKKYLSSIWESVVDGVTDINSHRTRSLLQVVGIILGVGSVVATAGLMAGSKKRLTNFYETTGGVRKMFIRDKEITDAVQTAAEKNSKGVTYDDALALLRDSTLLELVEPTLERRVTVRAPGYEKDLDISGATFAYEPMYDFHAIEGRFITHEDLSSSAKVVVLGSTRREQIYGARPAVGQVLTIANDRYTVVGVMDRKVFTFNLGDDNALEWMNEMIFVPVTTVLNRMVGDRQGQKLAYMNVQVRDVKDMDKAMEETATILRRSHGGVTDFEIVNRAQRMKQMAEQTRIYDMTFQVCGAISLLVGGIVIMNILLASFNERVREVGTRKALGATGLNIMAQFLVESVVLTILGGLVGLGVGAGFTRITSNLIGQPVVYTPAMVTLGLSFSVVVGIVFGFYPAVKAARLNPIEALRYE